MRKNIFLVMALFFMIPTIILFVMLGNHFSRKIIVLNGTQTEAEVVSYSSNVTENDVKLYKLKFLFYDEQGNQHFGETSSKYLYEEVVDIQTVIIKYNSNFKAVEADYKLNGVNIILFIILGIFTLADVLLWITFGKDVHQIKLGKVLLVSGYDAVAECLPMETINLTINGVPYYRIKYKYTDHYGVEHITKSREFYTYPQMMYLSTKGTIDIKEDGKHSVIAEDVKNVSLANLQQVDTPKKKAKKQCMYCGSVFDEDCNFCSKCGSNNFKNL